MISQQNLPPLILTLKMDEDSFEFFDRLRRRYFPRERNFLSAHLTLFHHLPGAKLAKIRADLANTCTMFAEFPLEFNEWRMLGRGVAIKVESPELHALRRDLSKEWDVWLTNQDRQKFQPHVTVQNKVSPDEAKDLYKNLSGNWQPRMGEARGLQLWHYMGGEWKFEADFLFSGRN